MRERAASWYPFHRSRPFSIRTRLVVGAAVVLAAFVVVAGLTLERAYSESVLTARYAKLQSDVYILMAAAEVDTDGTLIMPPTLAEPRFALPASGLYANVENMRNREEWQSASTVGQQIPFVRHLSPGQWHFGELTQAGRRFLGVAYGVNWSVGKKQQVLTFAATEDDAAFRRELLRYRTTLWSWLGGVVVGLLLAQTVLLSWGLAPLRRVAREIRKVETGDQSHVRGVYPEEIAGLTDNLNALIVQERARQSRYKDALGDLAHSLKTPLAVLRSALLRPESLAQSVDEQVARMDGIVQHQLLRAATSGAAKLSSRLRIAPVLQRVLDSLGKVYRDKQLQFTLLCPPTLSWRLDEGDAFEIAGNVLDNAAKWAKTRIHVTARVESKAFLLVIEDDGPGIADPQAVLKRGVRADERVPGQGIGLAVVADIVAAYGGEIHIGRSELGGASIGLSFPVTPAN